MSTKFCASWCDQQSTSPKEWMYTSELNYSNLYLVTKKCLIKKEMKKKEKKIRDVKVLFVNYF